MHEINIENLKDEAQRLLQVEITLLDKMKNEHGIITDAHSGESQTFDSNSIIKSIEVLQGEKAKLDGLEMVLAVVGTMKAGKSTTINAIVGTEVLPNRNRPMTALPTLIRHTKDQTEPVLKLENNRPINELIDRLNQAIISQQGKERLKQLERDSDMDDLLKHIQEKKQFGTIYRGTDDIYWLLKSLNDLVRLSKKLDIDFPFSDYDEIHELPVIEVEFSHLKEMQNSKGRLTLLDTPGPNEEGQQHFSPMLKEQLSKASAVLVVLDFTQLKSDADAKVRKEIEKVSNLIDGRAYVLVNKIDQKDRNSDTEEKIKSIITQDLMPGVVKEDLIFPVSSNNAYLANQALHELQLHNTLPDYTKQEWVKDFAKLALGSDWQEDITDIERIKKKADALWRNSNFSILLEKVIRSAHAKSAAYAIDSAAAKLIDNAERVGNFLGVRETALAKSTQELQQQIESLINDIGRIENSEKITLNNVNDTLSEISKSTEEVFDKIKKSATNTLDSYFKKGKKIEREQQNNKKEIEKKRQLPQSRVDTENSTQDPRQSILDRVLQRLSKKTSYKISDDSDFDPENPLMKFDNSHEANEIIENIQTSIKNIIDDSELAMKTAFQLIVDEFNNDFTKIVIKDSAEIIKTMQDRMMDSGFSLTIKMPDVTTLTIKFSSEDILNDVINEKTKEVTRYRRSSGVWGTLCSWFNTDDWGWESYQIEENFFEVDINKIRSEINKGLDKTFSGLYKSISECIRTPLKSGVTEFFTEFKQTVEQIRGDLLQSIRDQKRSKSEQDDLATRLAVLKKNVPALLHDSNGLKSDVTPLLTECKEICE